MVLQRRTIHHVLFALAGLMLAGGVRADSLALERHMARGTAAMEEAKSPADFQDAVREFGAAVQLAPDFADAWYNLGVAQEAAGDYAAALDSFGTYLKKAPNAPDRKAVQSRIFKLEYKADKQQKTPSTEAGVDLNGLWHFKRTFPASYGVAPEERDYRISVSNGNLTAQCSGASCIVRDMHGVVNGNTIQGSWEWKGYDYNGCHLPRRTYAFSADIVNSQTIAVNLKFVPINPTTCRFSPNESVVNETWKRQ